MGDSNMFFQDTRQSIDKTFMQNLNSRLAWKNNNDPAQTCDFSPTLTKNKPNPYKVR